MSRSHRDLGAVPKVLIELDPFDRAFLDSILPRAPACHTENYRVITTQSNYGGNYRGGRQTGHALLLD